MRNEEKTCSFCGSNQNYYAKGMCRNCYDRNRRNGKPDYFYKSLIGTTRQGYVCIKRDGQILTIRCVRCGHEKTISHQHFLHGNLAKCTDCLNHVRKGTEKNESIWKAWEQSGRNGAEAARKLGITRERVRQVVYKLSR